MNAFSPAPAPASFLANKVVNIGDVDPANRIPGMPPNLGRDVLPHVFTFQAMTSNLANVYRPSDEALRHDKANARFMRNDLVIREAIDQRQRSVSLLNWHLEPEDAKDPQQVQLCQDLTDIINRIPRFMQYRETLANAVWYGRYALQQRWEWRWIKGQKRQAIVHWEPLHGDKLVFRFDDGSGRYDPNEIGIRVGGNYRAGDRIGDYMVERIMPTDSSLAYFVPKWKRRLMAIHKHQIEDGEFEDHQNAGRIHGVGIRSVIYWTWYQKQELLAWLMEYLERSAFGIEIWKYPMGNKPAEEAMRRAAQERIGNGRNIIMTPTPVGEEYSLYDVQRIETGMAGAEVVKSILTEYFGHLIKRYILGQTLTSEAQGTGLGSGLAELHLDTFLQIIKYDATNVEETLTQELVRPLQLANFPKLANVHVAFKIDTEADDVEGKLAGWKNAWEMGLRIKASEVYDMLGASVPDDDDEVLQQQQQGQQPQPGGQGFAPAPGSLDRITAQATASLQASKDTATVEKAMGLDRPENSERDRVQTEDYSAWREGDHPRDDAGRFQAGDSDGDATPDPAASGPRGSDGSKPLHSFPNPEFGITSHVWLRQDGQYGISLHDDDADETVPSILIVKSLDDAIAKAKEYAGLTAPSKPISIPVQNSSSAPERKQRQKKLFRAATEHYAAEFDESKHPRANGRFANLKPHELSETNVGKQVRSLPGQRGLFGDDPKPAAPAQPPRPQQKQLFEAGADSGTPGLAAMFNAEFAAVGFCNAV